MLIRFKLEKEEFSEKYQERWWTYSIGSKFTFNGSTINEITITDHTWKKPGREKITKELILNILQTEVNNKRFFPTDYRGKRKVFLRERIPFDNKNYKLVFWFKDGATDHLWIRLRHQQD
ncbi:MAG: hypothetical protein MRERV_11c072 [Mycoplasmataceae bacterium RV_VA103A]|nr:MAG: hypothetical protein MRERV_11c072 [Mycoplasmataceae bacterium RV_VA103A]